MSAPDKGENEMTQVIEDTEMLSAADLLAGFLSTGSPSKEAEEMGSSSTTDAIVRQARANAGARAMGDMSEGTGPMVDPDDAAFMTGRGPTGRCRNFRQMSEAKLIDVFHTVRYEANDEYALEAIRAEMLRRGGFDS
jgi:hypothetical protein